MVDCANSTLIIRADANSKMGMGHVMRCLALAQGWQDLGGEVCFVGNITSTAFVARLQNEGFLFRNLAAVYPDDADLQCMDSLLTEGQWLVVDGYHFTAAYTRACRGFGVKVLVLDDYGHLPKYVADIVLNQNLGSDSLCYSVNPEALILAGSRYVLLRREFLQGQDGASEDVADVANHILVTLGGTDPENVSVAVLSALALLELEDLQVKIVVGAGSPHLQSVRDYLAQVSFAFELCLDVDDMAPLMVWADVAVTAGGSTCWELAYLGVPALIVVVAENQKNIALQLAAHGAAINLGWADLLKIEVMAQVVADLIPNKTRRQQLSERAKLLVNGHGVQLLVEQLEALS